MDLDAIIILTNQCNLNCSYCVYACDLKPKPYFITIEELQNTLNLMKEKLPSLQRIILSGGDAFMHPLIVQICEEVRKIFPDIELCAYTNGLLLNKITDSNILYMTQQLQLNIVSSVYPGEKNLVEYKNQDERFKQLGIELYYQFSHIYFTKQNYKYHDLNFPEDIINRQYKDRCRTITKYNNLITIYRNKILVCCGEVGYINNGIVDTSDLLDLNNLISEQQILDFCEKPHNICKTCMVNEPKSSCNVLWSRTNNLTKKYATNSLQQVFVKNYTDYKELCLNNKEHLFCYNDEFFYNKLEPEEKEYFDIKYKNGFADIFIPYDNSFEQDKIELLYNKLLNIPNVEKYNIYFVGIKTSSKYNNLMFKQFYSSVFNSKIKATFLLGRNLINGYEEFLTYSYLENKILLDIDTFLNSDQERFK